MLLRTLPDELPNMRNLLDAMAECRACTRDAAGLTYTTVSLLTGSVDTVAWFLTETHSSEDSSRSGNSVRPALGGS